MQSHPKLQPSHNQLSKLFNKPNRICNPDEKSCPVRPLIVRPYLLPITLQKILQYLARVGDILLTKHFLVSAKHSLSSSENVTCEAATKTESAVWSARASPLAKHWFPKAGDWLVGKVVRQSLPWISWCDCQTWFGVWAFVILMQRAASRFMKSPKHVMDTFVRQTTLRPLLRATEAIGKSQETVKTKQRVRHTQANKWLIARVASRWRRTIATRIFGLNENCNLTRLFAIFKAFIKAFEFRLNGVPSEFGVAKEKSHLFDVPLYHTFLKTFINNAKQK